MKHAGGRPTKYTPELLEAARSYIDRYVDSNKIPTLEGLALACDIRRSTLYEWHNGDVAEEFSDIVDKVMKNQAVKLIEQGLDGTYNASITKLLLTKHRYSDKQDVDHTTKGEQLPTPILGGAVVQSSNSDEETPSAE